MKWLYRILRLFFCPHKWIHKDTIRVFGRNIIDNKPELLPTYNKMIYECRYCGKANYFKM